MSPESLRDKLARLRGLRASGESLRGELAATRREHAPQPGDGRRPAAADPAGLREEPGPRGAHAARTQCSSARRRHGSFALGEVFDVDPRCFTLLAGDPALAVLDPLSTLFLDTETTGLSGGAGTRVFLIGLGRFVGGEFELWQGFLRDPGEEQALLSGVAERIRCAGAVVSFFGKSFDRHRLEDKMRVHGIEPPFAGKPHLDLYHPFRRLSAPHQPDGRLRTVEAAMTGVERHDDLPGSRAPAAWIDWLAGRPHELEGVFRHNRDDVLSLVVLCAYLGRVLAERRSDGTPLAGCARARARALARAALERRDFELAGAWLERALEHERAVGAAARDLLFERGRLRLRRGEHELARADFEALLTGPQDRWSVPATVELAKLLEHRLGAPGLALTLVRGARTMVGLHHQGSEARRLLDDLEHRERRLSRRQ